MKDFIIANLWKICSGVLLLTTLSRGCTNNKISNLEKEYKENTHRLEKKIDSLQVNVSTMATAKQVRDEMEVTMLNYLIYEDDLDKGKSSLSEVKNKIESND